MSVTLSEADDGKTIEAPAGSEIVVRLQENPTTGYRWHIDRANGLLEPEGDTFLPEPPQQFGSGGTRELRFRAKAAGAARLELKLWQEWEGESSVTKRFNAELRLT